MAWSPRGTHLAVCGGGNYVEVWDAEVRAVDPESVDADEMGEAESTKTLATE